MEKVGCSIMDINKYEQYNKEPFAACENPEVPMGKWLLENIPTKPKNLLDVGCGVGIHTKWFNEQGIIAKGITINPKEIEKRIHANVGLGSMLEIPYADNTFDCVFCLGTLEHTHSPFIALSEFNRVLKDSGYLFLDMCGINCMMVINKIYWYHKNILFPIQIRDMLLRSNFELVGGSWNETIKEDGAYTGVARAHYLAKKLKV